MIRLGALFVAVGLLAAGCGGDGDGDAATTRPDSQATTVAPGAGATTTQAEDDGGAVASGSAAERCQALFTVSEMADLFGEEAILDEAEIEESLGSLTCVWSTVEDPNDATDLSYDLLILQLYGGDPIPGENFFDASFYPDAEPVDGIGDQAFLEAVTPNNLSVHFLDDGVYGTISYTEAGSDSPAGLTDAQAIDLLEAFHDRAG